MRTPEQIWEDADLPARRLAGLALNPSATPEVLLRLLAEGPLAVRMVLCRDRDLPGAVVDAVIAHPDPRTRSFFAVNPHVDPAQRARLVDDPEWLVRAHVAQGPRATEPDRPKPLPDAAVVRILTTYEPEHLWSLYRNVSPELMRSLAAHPDAEARRHGVFHWSRMSDDERAALLADPDERVREAARACALHEDPAWVESQLPDRPCHSRTHLLLHSALSRAVVEGVLTAPADEDDTWMIAGNPTLPPDTVVLLAADPDPKVREQIAGRADLGPAERHVLVADPDPDVRGAVARHPDLDADERRTLATDPDPRVRLAVSVHPGLSEEERARVDYTVPMDRPFGAHAAPWPPRDPEAVRRDAHSGHPLLRRRAAREHTLAPDLVARLAEDDDLGVRVLLAQNHPDAPAELLLRSFLEYTGPERARLTTRPNFPCAGLAGCADHEDPLVRALAARDPQTPPGTVDRLTRDPDAQVRSGAARHPNLPPARLAELLADAELAHRAAANPALDPAVTRRLLETQGRGAR
ncbi:hypothetical protein AQI95_25850 [Streptomyces yokosukanensis]|uniref:LRV domain-containing protein n=1 Tax=Streptomyces yokosukanensis TaxID=67386 RepID=A0A124HF68_9ACTN|nr:hypothetical protein [Streptomyces yokosukanensis]KUN02952.1 hypothetical protein AQI95_25850 [Streptomyces yokosukanensis]